MPLISYPFPSVLFCNIHKQLLQVHAAGFQCFRHVFFHFAAYYRGFQLCTSARRIISQERAASIALPTKAETTGTMG